MFKNDKKEEKTPKKKEAGLIVPLKSWRIVCNKDDIQLKEGVEIKVPELYLPGLKTEGVI